MEHLSELITQKLGTILESVNRQSILSRQKAVGALFPYAIRLDQGKQQQMLDANGHVARVSGSVWRHIKPCIVTWSRKSDALFLNRAVMLMLPYVDWNDRWADKTTVTRWAVAALALPFTEEVCQSVVGVMLQIAASEFLRPHVPIDIWVWLKKQPYLPPWSTGLRIATDSDVIGHIRELGDIEILKSYALVVWSEWVSLSNSSLDGMEVSIREDFGGIRVSHHRDDLSKRLQHVLRQLDKGLEHFKKWQPGISGSEIQARKEQYRKLKEVLEEVDMSQGL